MDVDHGPVKGGAVAHPLSVATPSSDDMPSDWHLHQLQNQLARVLKSDPSNTELKPPRNYGKRCTYVCVCVCVCVRVRVHVRTCMRKAHV